MCIGCRQFLQTHKFNGSPRSRTNTQIYTIIKEKQGTVQVVLKSHTFDFYRNSCPPMNGCYKMQTFEQLQRVRLVPRTAQAGKGVLFQPGYIAAADAELCGDLLLRLRDGTIQAVPQGQDLLLALRQGGNQLA